MIVEYFRKTGIKRLVVMIIGNIFLGIGISIFKFSRMGNDPYSGMVMALAECVRMEYANFLLVVNLFLFLIEFLFGRKFIGVGTIVNACFLGYVVTFFYNILLQFFGLPEKIMIKVIIVLIGVVISCFGVSLYQTPNVGTAPYDSLSLIMAKRLAKVPYFWCRISTDALCAIICYLAGGIVGLGTLVTVFGFGPIVEFFNVHFTRKLFKDGENIL